MPMPITRSPVPANFTQAAAGDPNLLALVQGNLPNGKAIRLNAGANQYLDYTLSLSAAGSAWSVQQGRYNQFSGYWIFREDLDQCWQAQNTNGPLVYWNADGIAQWPPEDWELFVFQFAPGSQSSVVAKNIYGTNYMRISGTKFSCDGTLVNAMVWNVEF